MNSGLVSAGLAVELKTRLEPEGKEGVVSEQEAIKNVRFRWSSASSVSVAGSFSEWKQVELKRR